METYENSLVAKVYPFVFVNTFNSIVIIAFFKDELGFSCFNNNCFGELQNSMKVIFLMNFLKNLFSIGFSFYQKNKKISLKKQENIQYESIFRKID